MEIYSKETIDVKNNFQTDSNKSAERRAVSILYADIVSSTKIITSLDPEEITDFIDPAINKMIRAVHKFGGKVMKVQGDGIKAVFGATSSQEYHALRAAYAGQEILKLLRNDVHSSNIPTPEVRVGIHSDYVIVRWQHNDFGGGLDTVGTAAHIAAKIEEVSPKGRVTISQVTADLIKEYADLQKAESIDLEISELVGPLYHILSMGEGKDPGYKVLGKTHIPLVGRDEELLRIKNFLLGVESSKSNTLAVVGAPGIGKSRLVNEISIWALRKNFRIESVGGLVVFKDSPFYIIRKVLMKLLDINNSRWEQHTLERLFQNIPLNNNQLKGMVQLLSPEDHAWTNWDLPIDEKLKAIQTGVASLLENISQHNPVIMLVEDLHDIDSESLNCLKYFIKNCRHISLFIIFTVRPEGQDSYLLQSVTQVPLPRLSSRHSSQLVAAYCDSEVIESNPDIVGDILDRCEGVPLALLEFSKMAKLSKLRIEEQILPLALEPLIRQKIDELSTIEKNIVEHACVFGGDFVLSDCKAIMGLPEVDIEIGLKRLVEKKVFFYKKNDFIAFEHNLYREVAYKSLLRMRRRELHKKAYITLSKSQFVEPQILAYHASAANDSEAALRHLWKACDNAISQSAIRTVCNLYFRAIKLCDKISPSEDKQKIKFALKAFDAFHQLTLQGDLLEVYEGALECREYELEPEVEALVFCNLAVIKWIGGETITAIKDAQHALKLAHKINYFPMICYADFILANIEFSTGSLRMSVDRLRATSERFKNEERATRFGQTIILPSVMYRAFASWYCVDLGELEASEKFWATADKIAQIEDHEYSKSICNMALGYRLYRTDKFSEASEILTRVYKSCIENSYLGIAPMVAGWAGLSHLANNNAEAAERIIDQELSSNRIDRVKNACRYYALAAKAQLIANQGNSALALSWFEDALRSATITGDLVHQAYGHYELGYFHESEGRQNIAQKHFLASLKLSQETEMKQLEKNCTQALNL